MQIYFTGSFNVMIVLLHGIKLNSSDLCLSIPN